jgi:DsbC/DsbD-like thiol-disulfide interchange protein
MMNDRALRRLTSRLVLSCLALAIVCATGPVSGHAVKLRKGTARAGLKKSDSVVKVTATADKPDADGKQTVTVTLNIEKGWHTYARPFGNAEFDAVETTVSINADKKPGKVSVAYPKGKFDAGVKGNVYAGRTVIKAVVERAKGDTSPLQVTVKIQACTEKTCLLPATVKLTVE